MAGTFELKKAKNGEFHFSLKAGNGEIILVSELYKSHAAAVNGIESVKKNAPDDKRYDRRVASNGKLYFVLKASNGQIIGQSEMYGSEAARDAGIDAVKASASEAVIDDRTA